MKYHITGADEQTGETIELTVDAADPQSAREVAYRKGILVSAIAPAAVQDPSPSPQAFAAHVTRPLEHGHFRGVPVVNVAMPRRGSSLGVASLVLGVVAFSICWIPLVNLLGVPLSALGLILGLIGVVVALARSGAGMGYPIAGVAVCGFALFIAIGMTGAFARSIGRLGEEMEKESQRRNATNQSTVAAGSSSGDLGSASDRSNLAVSSSVTVSSPASESSEWSSAAQPVKQGSVQVQVKAVKVGKVVTEEWIGEETGRSRQVLVSIELEITNSSETKKIEYTSWGNRGLFLDKDASLTDNFDNQYAIVRFGFGRKVAGSVERESIYPGKAIMDVIVFEEPIAKAEYLNMELSAENFGGSGMLRIRIPASMIQR